MMHETGALDRFRLFAAFMIVAIHMAVYDPAGRTAEFLAVYVGARIAVPFFFMLTGYFVLPCILQEGGAGRKKLGAYLNKTLLFYAAVSLLYAPLSIYAGYYDKTGLARQIVRKTIFDGTFYHLWYLPASMLGVCLICLLFRKLSAKQVGAVSVVLYAVGLLGDSYYGAAHMQPMIRYIYEAMFSVFSYTRNGIFYAPLFLWMGWRIACRAAVDTRKKTPVPFIVCFVLMLGEGFAVSRLGLQRHSSMYLILPLCMYFLFDWLQARGGRESRFMRHMAGWVYVLHPLCIVAVRICARAAGMQALLVESSLGLYVSVCVLTAVPAAGITWLQMWVYAQKRQTAGRAWIELDAANLLHNVAVLQRQMPSSCALMPALKANAYGHGAVQVARILRQAGIKDCCTATAQEGAALRKAGMRGEILVLGYTPDEALSLVRKYRLTQTAVDCADALRLHRYGHKLRVHLKVDTGMHRLGERCENTVSILEAFNLSGIKITGLYSHIGADYTGQEADSTSIAAQIEAFETVYAAVCGAGHTVITHLQSSYGIMCQPLGGYDYVRPGIALYGMLGSEADTRRYADALRPVLQMKCKIACVKWLKAGECAGYGSQFHAPRDMKLAVLGAGYADGIPRSLSSGVGSVLIGGVRCPVIGRICMDQMLVDATGAEGVCAGDTAVLIGRSGEEEITACEVAQQCGTITNEILSRLGERLTRSMNG